MTVLHPKAGLPLRQVDYVAARITHVQVLCAATIATGLLLGLTGPSTTPYLEWLTALPVWPEIVGATMTGAGLAVALGVRSRIHPLATIGATVAGALYLVLAAGFAVGWAVYLTDPDGHPRPFVYPLAVYAGLAALHFVHADTEGRAWRRTRDLRRL